VAGGRGTILALPHSGNWDHAGAWCTATGVPFTTVAERLRPESLYDRFVAFRESLGMEVVPLTGGTRPPFVVLAERLRAGGMLCLLSDRDLSARGIDVRFFGATARMPAGPAALALRTGATLLPVTLSFTPDGWHCVFHPEVPHTDIRTMTQQVADAFEEGIRAHPADWHMLQRLCWTTWTPPGRPREPPAAHRLACPYTWDVPAGCRRTLHDLADHLIALGHSGLGAHPVDDPDRADLPPYVVPSGGPCRSVQRLGGPAGVRPASLARTRRWLRDGSFDVLHEHEPTVPSVSMLACFAPTGRSSPPSTPRRPAAGRCRCSHRAPAGADEGHRTDRRLAGRAPGGGRAPGR
jgi:hypothetical protein